MSRPRSFDIDDVLAKAMAVFWKRGYAATSLSDIYRATGLKPGNVYGAFRDKDDLFRQCFETYAAHFRATLPAGLSGRAAIEKWLEVQADIATDDPERPGCMIVNTIAERALHPEETHRLADARLAEIRSFFLKNLVVGRERGEIDATRDPEMLADGLVAAVVAMMTLGRGGADRRTIAHVAENAMLPLMAI